MAKNLDETDDDDHQDDHHHQNPCSKMHYTVIKPHLLKIIISLFIILFINDNNNNVWCLQHNDYDDDVPSSIVNRLITTTTTELPSTMNSLKKFFNKINDDDDDISSNQSNPSSSVSLSSNVTTLKHPPIIFERKKRVSSTSSSSSAINKSNNQQQLSDSSSIRQSAYVCEDDQLELSCLNDKHLDILRANFGRFSITVCNPSGFLDWSVNCASGNSILPILTERCANQKHCSIRASSLIFGDPCPGTAKYLEVHYRCVSEMERILSLNKSMIASNDSSASTTTTTIGLVLSSDLYFLRKNSDNHSVSMTTTISTTIGFDNDHQQQNSLDIVPNQSDLKSFSDKSDKSSTQNNQKPYWSNMMDILAEPSSSSASSTTTMSTTCNQKIYRNIQWPPTLSGSIAIRPCPHDTSGLAQWKCGNTANRIDGKNNHFSNTKKSSTSQQQQNPKVMANNNQLFQSNRASSLWIHFPDLSQCHSRWLLQLNSLQNSNLRNDIWQSILANIQQQQQHSTTTTTLYGGDLNQLIVLMENWSIRYYQNNGNYFDNFFNDNSHKQLAELDTIFEIISELLNQNNQPSWLDLPDIRRESAAINLIDITGKYSALHCRNQRLSISSSNDSKEMLKQSSNLVISCFSITKLLNEFHLNWNKLNEQHHHQQRCPPMI